MSHGSSPGRAARRLDAVEATLSDFDLSWDDVRYFLAVVDTGTVSGAGKLLGVDHSTVLRRISALEDRLETRLFDRQARGYAPTRLAETLVPSARKMREEMNRFARLALGSDQSLRGEIRVTTVVDFGELVCKHLPGFYEQFPNIRLHVDIGEEVQRLGDRKADVAIRPVIHQVTEPDIVAKRICGIALALYGSRSYLARRAAPRRREDLANHALIVGHGTFERIPLMRWLIDHMPEERIVYRANTFANQLAAIRAGFGVGVAPCGLCDPLPDLVRLFQPEVVSDLFVLYHQDLRNNARVRAFVDYIHAALVTDADLIEGRKGPQSMSLPAWSR
jgi:DNA-binding transcriptional LysR family regulator